MILFHQFAPHKDKGVIGYSQFSDYSVQEYWRVVTPTPTVSVVYSNSSRRYSGYVDGNLHSSG